MQVELTAISFNHDQTSAETDAFNITKNETTPVVLPEWRRGVNTRPEDSLAAYSLSDTKNKVLTIKASFSVSDAAIQELSIRAVGTSSSRSVRNVLGEVAETKVAFANGVSSLTSFELKGASIWSEGVGVYDIEWLWQFRLDSSAPWSDFDRSSHRIYTTLNLPRKPWTKDPSNSQEQLVWTDVLDHACVWARRIQDNVDRAGTEIVREVFALGPRFIQFDNQNHGASHYSDDTHFDCTAFLLRLAGQESNGRFVNCTDCAAIVSTFANAIGCDLSQAQMAPPPGGIGFPLNPHLRIGLPNQHTGSFRYHEVAWKGACGEADDVFDACLKLNISNNPTVFTSRVASNLPFGRLKQRQYRFRLVGQAGQANCVPLNGSAIQRALGPVPQTLRTGPIATLPPPPPTPNNFVTGFSFDGFEPAGFELQRAQNNRSEGDVPVILSFWTDKNQDQSLIRIDTYECSSATDARKGVLHLLDDFQLPGIESSASSNGHIFAFENADNSTVLFAAANIVFLLRNVGSATSQLSTFVTSLKEYALSPGNIGLPAPENAAKQFHIGNEGVVGSKLEIQQSAEEGSRIQHWFSSERGEISREGNKLVYEPARPGDHTIGIWNLEAGRTLSLEYLQLHVADPATVPEEQSTNINEKETNIMSIFDGNWHSYRESAGNSPALESHGSFSFTVGSDGALTGSMHDQNAITGTVDAVSRTIDLTENDPTLGGPVRYVGSVVFEGTVGNEARVVACGRFIFNQPPTEAQEEGTWVITKP